MPYQIEVTRHYYGPRTTKHTYQTMDGEPTFESRDEALVKIAELDAQPYETDHNESSRPEYRPVKA